MSGVSPNAVEAGSATLPASPASVMVWDPLVRGFHWGVVGLFVLAYATGDDFETAHQVIGYALVGLLAVRVVWGFVGPEHARFRAFVRSPSEVVAFLRQLRAGTAPRTLGHNPAGGAMALALMAMLAAIGLTGHLMTTDAFWGSEVMEGLHELLVNATIVLVVLHVVGNIASSLAHGENLVRAMITGRKRPL